ncbi:Deoxyuridine 5'-triphosphate nucleotidohydrolase [Schaereria dolodes]|nr:Deoxyuridine 5'-triphosphate nucleotidohydrolase [Schaereria dolodes]
MPTKPSTPPPSSSTPISTSHPAPSPSSSPLAKRPKPSPPTTSMPSSNTSPTPAVAPLTSSPPLLIKALSPTAKPPTRGSAFAAGYDLYSAVDTVIAARGKGLVGTGLAIAVPGGTLKEGDRVAQLVLERIYTPEVVVVEELEESVRGAGGFGSTG